MRDPIRFTLASIAILASLIVKSPSMAAEVEAYEPGAGIDIVSQSVEITPDFQSKSLNGRVRMIVRATRPISYLAFSKNSLIVEGAQLNGQRVVVRRDGGKVIFIHPRPLKTGQRATLTVSLRGKPARGVTFTDQSVFTSYWACDWMICSQDVPGDVTPNLHPFAIRASASLLRGCACFLRGGIPERGVGPAGVVIIGPCGDLFAIMSDAGEQCLIEKLVTHPPAKAFYERVLGGLPRSGIVPLDLGLAAPFE